MRRIRINHYLTLEHDHKVELPIPTDSLLTLKVASIQDKFIALQESLDALRFSVDVQDTGAVRVEEDLDRETVAELKRRGHDVVVVEGYDRTMFGGGQVISHDPETGVLTAGSEPRKDGAAVGW